MRFVDSHCHLDRMSEVQEMGVSNVLKRAERAGVEHILCVNVTLSQYENMRAVVGTAQNVSFSCGLHPLYIKQEALDEKRLLTYLDDKDVVAVGETGLDYFYDKDTIQAQRDSLAKHIEIANQVSKPLIIHTRDAREDTIAMLKEGDAERCGGVLHCFTETKKMAKQALDMGFYISISGIVSFASAGELREVVEYLPLDRMLIETDSPWLAPVPYRGKENEPAFVVQVAKTIAEVKNLPVKHVAEITRQNFYQLFSQAS